MAGYCHIFVIMWPVLFSIISDWTKNDEDMQYPIFDDKCQSMDSFKDGNSRLQTSKLEHLTVYNFFPWCHYQTLKL